MKAKLEVGGQLLFWCPGCKQPHMVVIHPDRWMWNGDAEKPTIRPSALTKGHLDGHTGGVCHLFVTDGQIRYLDDTTHELSGQTIPMEDWPYEETGEIDV